MRVATWTILDAKRHWDLGAIHKYEFYGIVRDLIESRQINYRQVDDLTGIHEEVIRDRVRYLRRLGGAT